jgi:hypothetical protein
LSKAQSAVGALQIQLSDALAEIKRLTSEAGVESSGAAIEAARQQWQAEEQARVAKLEALLKAQAQKQVDDVRSELTAALKAIEQLRAQQPDTVAAQLASAKSEWRAEEARRLAQAEAEWARQSEEKIDALQAQLSEARKKHLKLQSEKSTDWQAELEAARAEWKDEEAKRVARVEAQLTAKSRERIEELEAQLHEALAVQKRMSSEIAADGKADLDAARAAWKAEEVARLAQSEASWASQVNFLKAELVKARTSQATVDSEDLQAQLRQIRQELQTGFDQKLAAAEAEWSKTHGAALKEREESLQGKIRSLEGQLKSEREKPAAPAASSSDPALKDVLAKLQASLAEREDEVLRLTKQVEAERAARRKELQELHAAHEMSNRAEVELREQHAVSLEQTESRWKQTATAEIKAATSRAEAAESKLQELRAAAADAARLDKEVVMLRATLVEREQELHRLQHHSTSHVVEETPAPPAPTGFKKLLAMPYLREAAVGVACTVLTILLLPGAGVPIATGEASAPNAEPSQVVGLAQAAAPKTLLQTAVVLRNTRLRAAPDKSAGAIVRLDRGVEVGVLGIEGDWAHVKMNYKTKVAEGWVEKSFLDLSGYKGQ